MEFIKWLVGYAEGFELNSEDGDDFSISIPLKNTILESWCNHFRVDTWKNIYYPLLLQRVLREKVKCGIIHHDFNLLRKLILDDKKLEVWLKYQWEKENEKR